LAKQSGTPKTTHMLDSVRWIKRCFGTCPFDFEIQRSKVLDIAVNQIKE